MKRKLILRAALSVDVAQIPAAVCGSGLGSPIRPDTKIGIAEPLGNLLRLQRRTGPVEKALLDFRNNVLRERLARKKERGRSGYRSNSCPNRPGPAMNRWGEKSAGYRDTTPRNRLSKQTVSRGGRGMK